MSSSSDEDFGDDEPEVFGALICDLDNTLANCDHRIHHASAREWDEFHSKLMDDPVYEDVAMIIANLPVNIKLIAVTGRNERYRQLTLDWLAKNSLQFDEILMRPDGNYIPDHELKPKMLIDFFDGDIELAKQQVICILDDRDKVVSAYRELGFPCWQVRSEKY